MDDAAPVRRVERAGDLDRRSAAPARSGSAPLGQAVRQRLALEELHDEVVGPVLVADVVEHADVRMREREIVFASRSKPLPQLRRGGHVRGQHLDRDVASQPRVLRPVDLAHSAGADGGGIS